MFNNTLYLIAMKTIIIRPNIQIKLKDYAFIRAQSEKEQLPIMLSLFISTPHENSLIVTAEGAKHYGHYA